MHRGSFITEVWIREEETQTDWKNNKSRLNTRLFEKAYPKEKTGGSYQLREACNSGNLECVKDILEYFTTDLDIDAMSEGDGLSALHSCIIGNHIDIMEYLLLEGADVNLESHSGTPLRVALMVQNERIIEILLKNGANVNQKTLNLYPLEFAIQQNYIEGVNCLLRSKKLQLFHSDFNSLACAAEFSRPSIVQLLVTRFKKKVIHSVLLKSLRNRDHKVIAAIIKNKIKIPKSMRKEVIEIIKEQDITALEVILKYHKNTKWMKPLIFIPVNWNLPQIVDLFLFHNFDVESMNKRGLTPLQVSIENNSTRVLKVLLKHHACTESLYIETGLAPLHVCVNEDKYELAEVLLTHGCFVNVLSVDQKSPIYHAVEQRKLDFVKLLMRFKPDLSIFSQKYPPVLHLATMKGYPEIIDILLDREDCASLITQRHRNGTALHAAILSKTVHQYFVIKKLLGKGSDVESITSTKLTPIQLAVKTDCSFKIIKLIAKFGAKLDVLDEDGNTLIHLAAACNTKESLQLILFLMQSGQIYADQPNHLGYEARDLIREDENELRQTFHRYYEIYAMIYQNKKNSTDNQKSTQ